MTRKTPARQASRGPNGSSEGSENTRRGRGRRSRASRAGRANRGNRGARRSRASRGRFTRGLNRGLYRAMSDSPNRFGSSPSSSPQSQGFPSRPTPSPRRPGPSPSPSDDSQNNNVCVICHNQISQLSITNCEHRFCRDCITRWMRESGNCPTCRTSVHTIRIILPEGGTEIIEISQAELVAHKINELHAILILLFTTLSHTLLPEVTNYISQLNDIAREMNVPTTSSRLQEQMNSMSTSEDETDSSATGTARTSGRSSVSDITMRSQSMSPASSLERQRSRSIPDDSLRFSQRFLGQDSPRSTSTISSSNLLASPSGSESEWTIRSFNEPSPAAKEVLIASKQSTKEAPIASKQIAKEAPIALKQSVMPAGHNSVPASKQALKIPVISSRQYIGPTVKESNIQASKATFPGVPGGVRIEPTSYSRLSGFPSSSINTRTTQESPRDGSRSQQNRSSLPGRSSELTRHQITGPGFSSLNDDYRRIEEHRQRDINLLRESFNKINQVYEPLMMLHMVVHRNQVDIRPATTDNSQGTN